MEPKILGANIRNYRKQIGLTQEKLAERIGKSVNYVGMIERGCRSLENQRFPDCTPSPPIPLLSVVILRS